MPLFGGDGLPGYVVSVDGGGIGPRLARRVYLLSVLPIAISA